MATELSKISSTLNESYNVSDDAFIGTVNVVKNDETGELTNINGQVFVKNSDGTKGSNVGNFNGSKRAGIMYYTTSQMTREQHTGVMTLIGEIESQLESE